MASAFLNQLQPWEEQTSPSPTEEFANPYELALSRSASSGRSRSPPSPINTNFPSLQHQLSSSPPDQDNAPPAWTRRPSINSHSRSPPSRSPSNGSKRPGPQSDSASIVSSASNVPTAAPPSRRFPGLTMSALNDSSSTSSGSLSPSVTDDLALPNPAFRRRPGSNRSSLQSGDLSSLTSEELWNMENGPVDMSNPLRPAAERPLDTIRRMSKYLDQPGRHPALPGDVIWPSAPSLEEVYVPPTKSKSVTSMASLGSGKRMSRRRTSNQSVSLDMSREQPAMPGHKSMPTSPKDIIISSAHSSSTSLSGMKPHPMMNRPPSSYYSRDFMTSLAPREGGYAVAASMGYSPSSPGGDEYSRYPVSRASSRHGPAAPSTGMGRWSLDGGDNFSQTYTTSSAATTTSSISGAPSVSPNPSPPADDRLNHPQLPDGAQAPTSASVSVPAPTVHPSNVAPSTPLVTKEAPTFATTPATPTNIPPNPSPLKLATSPTESPRIESEATTPSTVRASPVPTSTGVSPITSLRSKMSKRHLAKEAKAAEKAEAAKVVQQRAEAVKKAAAEKQAERDAAKKKEMAELAVKEEAKRKEAEEQRKKDLVVREEARQKELAGAEVRKKEQAARDEAKRKELAAKEEEKRKEQAARDEARRKEQAAKDEVRRKEQAEREAARRKENTEKQAAKRKADAEREVAKQKENEQKKVEGKSGSRWKLKAPSVGLPFTKSASPQASPRPQQATLPPTGLTPVASASGPMTNGAQPFPRSTEERVGPPADFTTMPPRPVHQSMPLGAQKSLQLPSTPQRVNSQRSPARSAPNPPAASTASKPRSGMLGTIKKRFSMFGSDIRADSAPDDKSKNAHLTPSAISKAPSTPRIPSIAPSDLSRAPSTPPAANKELPPTPVQDVVVIQKSPGGPDPAAMSMAEFGTSTPPPKPVSDLPPRSTSYSPPFRQAQLPLVHQGPARASPVPVLPEYSRSVSQSAIPILSQTISREVSVESHVSQSASHTSQSSLGRGSSVRGPRPMPKTSPDKRAISLSRSLSSDHGSVDLHGQQGRTLEIPFHEAVDSSPGASISSLPPLVPSLTDATAPSLASFSQDLVTPSTSAESSMFSSSQHPSTDRTTLELGSPLSSELGKEDQVPAPAVTNELDTPEREDSAETVHATFRPVAPVVQVQ